LFLLGILVGSFLALSVLQTKNDPITAEMVRDAATVIGLEFTQTEIDTMLDMLTENRTDLQNIRDFKIENSIPPALVFNPVPVGKQFETEQKEIEWNIPESVEMPANIHDLAFYSVTELS